MSDTTLEELEARIVKLEKLVNGLAYNVNDVHRRTLGMIRLGPRRERPVNPDDLDNYDPE